jgi:hypothetical protein
MRLRIAWGGGTPTAWVGSLRLSAGELRDVRSLGMDVDSAGAFLSVGSEIPIRSPAPHAFDAIDVTLKAELTETLTVQLAKRDSPERPSIIPIPVQQLISETHSKPIDRHGNRLLIRRAPGDSIRIQHERDHLVFAPGESWMVEVHQHLLPLPEGSVRLVVEVFRGRTQRSVWRLQKVVPRMEGESSGKLESLEIPLPESEGVYDIQFSLDTARPRMGFKQWGDLERRTVQVIVLDNKAAKPSTDARWKELLAFDPSQPRWWERLSRVPGLHRMPLNPRSGLVQGSAYTWQHDTRCLSRLDPSASQMYPLAIVHTGCPHVLEIELATDGQQTVGVAVVEPDVTSDADPITTATTLHVGFPLAADGVQVCRLPFWPRTRAPCVMLTNLSETQPALFGTIRVLEGPAELTGPAGLPQPDGKRSCLVYFDQPLFTRAFTATGALDSQSQRALTDWQTFYEGGQRLIQFLRQNGFCGAVVTALSDGGTIYPSPQLDASARFDTGAFFNNGQDPLQKDVLELLSRIFDREGLQLVPALEFGSALPELERQLAEGEGGTGIELLDIRLEPRCRADGDSRRSHYNPLDPRVQDAMAAVVRHMARRYAPHSSFAGISLCLSQRSDTQLPGVDWGYDQRTLERFLQERGLDAATLLADRDRLVDTLRTGELASAWFHWRATQISRLFERLAAEVRHANSDAKLILAGSDLVEVDIFRDALTPVLRKQDRTVEALYQMGLDATQLARIPGLVFLRPHRLALIEPLVARGPGMQVSTSPELDSLFREVSQRSVLFDFLSHDYTVTMPRINGGRRTARVVTQAIPAVAANRQRFVQALAAHDAQLIVDGGAVPNTAQADELRPFLDVFCRLPAAPFHTANPPESRSGPILVRTLADGGQTYVYALNNSPWPVTTTVRWSLPAGGDWAPLGDRSAGMWKLTGGSGIWTIRFEPFDLVGGQLSTGMAEILSIHSQVPSAAVAQLQEHISELVARTAKLKDPSPWNRLENPGFESPAVDSRIPGWEHTTADGIAIRLDSASRRSGTTALMMHSAGSVASIRSHVFDPPETGRLSLKVWLKTDRQAPWPALRLAIEGRFRDQPYYRYAALQERVAVDTREDDWSPILLHIDDLPAAGLDQLRARFDLVGPGTIWLDDVQLYDLSFTAYERQQLSKIIALADLQLREDRVGDCARTLQRYWPQYILAHSEPSERQLASVPERPPLVQPASPPPERKPNVLDRMRRLVPRLRRS